GTPFTVLAVGIAVHWKTVGHDDEITVAEMGSIAGLGRVDDAHLRLLLCQSLELTLLARLGLVRRWITNWEATSSSRSSARAAWASSTSVSTAETTRLRSRPSTPISPM